MHDDSPIRSLAARDAVVVIVEFPGSEPLQHMLRARGARVCVLASLSAAIEAMTGLPAAVLVIRLALETTDADVITLVVRNFRTPGILRDPEPREAFHDWFGQCLSGPVDTQTLADAVARHAGPSMGGDRPVRHRVA